MKKQLCVVLLLLTSSLALTATAGSTRVEVYPLSQTYIDTREGDTLSELVADLLPHNPELQRLLMRDILLRNPHAFPGSSIDTMLANERLWLPNAMQQSDSKPNDKDVEVESFSWGNVKRPRQ